MAGPKKMRSPRSSKTFPGQRRAKRSLVALLAACSLAAGPGARADPRIEVSVTTGLAAVGDVDIGGDVLVGWAPSRVERAVQTALAEENERARAVAAQISQLSRRFEVGNCTVEKLLHLAAAAPGDPRQFAADFAALVTEHRRVTKGIGELSGDVPGQALVREQALLAVGEGNYDRASRLLVSVDVGIAAGRDVIVEGDVTIGMTEAQVERLIAFARESSEQNQTVIEELSAHLGVSRCATANFLRILGEKQVPLDQLAQKLSEIAARHVELLKTARLLEGINPELEGMKREIAVAIEDGHYGQADILLEQAVRRELEAAAQQRALVDALRGKVRQAETNAAKSEATRGDLHLARLEYAVAAENFVKAAEIAREASPADRARYLDKAGGAYQDAGDLVAAEQYLREALDLRRAGAASGPLDLAVSLSNLATLYYAQARFDPAEENFKQALAQIDAAPGDWPLEREVVVSGLAEVFSATNRFEEAERNYREALAILETKLGPQDVRLASVLTNLGRLVWQLNRDAEAEDYYTRALDIEREGLAPDHPAIAVTLTGLAAVQWTLEKFDEAEAGWYEAMVIFETALGPRYVGLSAVYINLAQLSRRMRDLAQAEAYANQALDIAEESLGRRHPAVASILNTLGDIYRSQQRYDDAAKLYSRALLITEAAMGKEHILVAQKLSDLAGLDRRAGRLDLAEQRYERALRIYRRVLGAEHRGVGILLNNLASISFDRGRFAEAERMYREALAITAKSLGPGHSSVAIRYANLAETLLRQERYAEAEQDFRQALRISEQAGGQDSLVIARRFYDIGRVLQMQEKAEEAVDFYCRATPIAQNGLPAGDALRSALEERIALLKGNC